MIQSFPENPLLCPILAITAYLSRTKPLCGDNSQFFIYFVLPHKSIQACTLARWMKQILSATGAYISIFTAHTVRGASAVFMRDQRNYSVKEICTIDNWSTKSGVSRSYMTDISLIVNTIFSGERHHQAMWDPPCPVFTAIFWSNKNGRLNQEFYFVRVWDKVSTSVI